MAYPYIEKEVARRFKKPFIKVMEEMESYRTPYPLAAKLMGIHEMTYIEKRVKYGFPPRKSHGRKHKKRHKPG